ncbi:MAG: hypothetical protein JW727_00125 [Candidatus Aenigmarchaeota archaeon]|nr:hypothetical protein [Candidatus Aenigmarchaeota archaeon]
MQDEPGISSPVFFALLLFLAVFLIISPFVHEMGHIAAIRHSGCDYTIHRYQLSLLGGLEASTEIKCPLPLEVYPLILVSGSLSTFILGNFLLLCFFLFLRVRGKMCLKIFFLAQGFILHSMVYFFERGEFDLFLLLEGQGYSTGTLPVVGTVLIAMYLSLAYFSIKKYVA